MAEFKRRKGFLNILERIFSFFFFPLPFYKRENCMLGVRCLEFIYGVFPLSELQDLEGLGVDVRIVI